MIEGQIRRNQEGYKNEKERGGEKEEKTEE